MSVHLLTLDGEYSVHATQRKAILHYITVWPSSIELNEAIWKRFNDAKLDAATRSIMERALKENYVPEEEIEIDFSAYLWQCEDVCFYQVLEMELE